MVKLSDEEIKIRLNFMRSVIICIFLLGCLILYSIVDQNLAKHKNVYFGIGIILLLIILTLSLLYKYEKTPFNKKG